MQFSSESNVRAMIYSWENASVMYNFFPIQINISVFFTYHISHRLRLTRLLHPAFSASASFFYFHRLCNLLPRIALNWFQLARTPGCGSASGGLYAGRGLHEGNCPNTRRTIASTAWEIWVWSLEFKCAKGASVAIAGTRRCWCAGHSWWSNR